MKSLSTSVIGSILSPLLIALLLQGCATPGDETPGVRSAEESEAINDYVEELGKLEVLSPLDETLESSDYESESPSGPLFCSSKTFHKIQNFDRFVAQGGAVDKLYPGALLDGNSLTVGAFDEIPLRKNPLTVSIVGVDQAGAITSTAMENPTISDFTAAQQRLLLAGIEERQAKGIVAQPLRSQLTEIATINEDQLSLTLGFDVSVDSLSGNFNVAGSFNFNDETKRSRYLVTMVQELYTMVIDKPAFASDYFADNISLSDVQRAFGAGQPPVYIDSITYGRTVYLAVESEFSATELEAALKASADTATLDAELNFGLTARQVLQSSRFEGIIVGPLPGDQADLNDLRGSNEEGNNLLALSRLAAREAAIAPGFPGQPLSFTVAYLLDNSRTVNSVDGIFTQENCVPDFGSANVRANVNQMVVTAVKDTEAFNTNNARIFGTIAVVSGGQRVILFDQSRDNTVTFQAGTVSGNESFWKTGTIQDLDLTPGNTVTVEVNLFEKDGSGGNPDDVHVKISEITVEELMTGEVRIPLEFGALDANDGVFHGTLHIGFQVVQPPLFGGSIGF